MSHETELQNFQTRRSNSRRTATPRRAPVLDSRARAALPRSRSMASDGNDSSTSSSCWSHPKMHPITLAFDHPAREQDFQTQQAKSTLAVGFFGNVCVIIVAASIAVREVRSVNISSFAGAVFALQAVVGMTASMQFGRLGDAALEHRLLVRINVANVVIGQVLVTIHACMNPSEGALMGELAYCGFMSCSALVIVCTHLLVFPFWARCCICPMYALMCLGVSMSRNHSFTSLGTETELTLVTVAALAGEALGHLLHRSARQQYLERSNEREVLRERTEQLVSEKERLDFERQMAVKQALGVSENPYIVGRVLAGCGGSFRDDNSSSAGDSMMSFGTHPELVHAEYHAMESPRYEWMRSAMQQDTQTASSSPGNGAAAWGHAHGFSRVRQRGGFTSGEDMDEAPEPVQTQHISASADSVSQ